MKTCYRALVMRVTEVYIEVWADSYEEAIVTALDDEADSVEVEHRVYEDELVDIIPWSPDYPC